MIPEAASPQILPPYPMTKEALPSLPIPMLVASSMSPQLQQMPLYTGSSTIAAPTVVVEHRYVLPEDLEAQQGRRYHDQLLARCSRGEHVTTKKYGPCGIISSVLLFPIGLVFLFIDNDKWCTRCGQKV